MADIVERLRFRAEENYEMLGNIHEPLLEAADEITRLRAENEKLRAALEPFACTCDRPNGAACSRSEVDCPFWNARAALEGKQ